MTTKIVEVILDSVRKDGVAGEFRYVNRASCPEYDLVEVGDGPNLTKVLKQLRSLVGDSDAILNIKRNGNLAFMPTTLKEWFADRRPEHLKKG